MTELLEPPETVDIGELEERLAQTQISAPGNLGVVVGSVAGDILVQVDRLRRMERLDPEYVRATVAAYVDRTFLSVSKQELNTDQIVDRLRTRHSIVGHHPSPTIGEHPFVSARARARRAAAVRARAGVVA